MGNKIYKRKIKRFTPETLYYCAVTFFNAPGPIKNCKINETKCSCEPIFVNFNSKCKLRIIKTTSKWKTAFQCYLLLTSSAAPPKHIYCSFIHPLVFLSLAHSNFSTRLFRDKPQKLIIPNNKQKKKKERRNLKFSGWRQLHHFHKLQKAHSMIEVLPDKRDDL